MSDRAIDWEDQRVFLSVLESGSLSGAARRLGLAQPTVRRRIESLEQATGAALFTRSPNGLSPTDQAHALAGYVRTMASSSEAFVRAASASSSEVGGTVRISVSEFVGSNVLPAMLKPLRRRHPRLAIEIAASNAAADLLDQEADIAVRMHRPKQAALIARHVGAIALALFAHRDYAATRGLPSTVVELRRHDLIGPDRTRADLAMIGAVDSGLTRTSFAIRADSHAAQLSAIRAGLGIGVLQRPFGLADPNLVAVLPDVVVHRMDTWIVAHEDLRQAPRVAVTFDHLVAALTTYIGDRSSDVGCGSGLSDAAGCGTRPTPPE